MSTWVVVHRRKAEITKFSVAWNGKLYVYIIKYQLAGINLNNWEKKILEHNVPNNRFY